MSKNKYFYGEHFESLGNAWQAIYGCTEQFVVDYLRKSIQEGKLSFCEKVGRKIFYGLKYPENSDMQILNYIKKGFSSNTHISACPALKGIKNTVVLKDTYDWENGVEGEMAAESTSINELMLNFFNPFYLIDKNSYQHNKTQDVYLAAVAECIEELGERDDVYTEGALYDLYLEKFLEENPDKTEADFEPPVIKLRAESFRMYDPHDTTSVIEIVGLIEDIKYTKFLDKKFAVLKVNLEHREDNQYLYVNVYVGEQFLEKYHPEVGKGVVAVIWLTGYFEPLDSESYTQKNIKVKRTPSVLSLLMKFIIWILLLIAVILSIK